VAELVEARKQTFQHVISPFDKLRAKLLRYARRGTMLPKNLALLFYSTLLLHSQLVCFRPSTGSGHDVAEKLGVVVL
jgi:hypothetical protein